MCASTPNTESANTAQLILLLCSYTLRVGRTGRAGDKEGLAFSLLLPRDTHFASELVQSLAMAGQDVPADLHEMAMKVGVSAE